MRDLNLSYRRENTRDKNVPKVVAFDIAEIENHFFDSICMVRKQFETAEYLCKNGKQGEAENIWRSQIVFLESAFDFFMHEVTKYGLMRIFLGEWERTTRYRNIDVTMDVVERALLSDEDTEWFLAYINQKYAGDTLVSASSVKQQLNLLGIRYNEVADGAFYDLNSEERTKDKLVRRLNELYSRRNVIAHQTDRNHYNARQKEINKELVEEFIVDIEKIVRAIITCICEK